MGQTDPDQKLEGGCACGNVRYRMNSAPMFVNCCHCTWCQRETGTAFALNAMIESDRLELTSGELDVVEIPSDSGKGQKIFRCPDCKIAVWSHYVGAGDKLSFVRVGSLDEAHLVQPDIHIYTSTKQPWVSLSGEVPVVEEYCNPKEHWPEEAQKRYKALKD